MRFVLLIPHKKADSVINQKFKVIFDTDIAEDCDDVGVLAVLHALADKGELEILGMMVSMPVASGTEMLANTTSQNPIHFAYWLNKKAHPG